MFDRGKPKAWFADAVTEVDMRTLGATQSAEWQAEFELLAIVVAVRLWVHELTDESFAVLQTDAMAALGAARRLAGRSPVMNFLAGEYALTLETHNMTASHFHLPGTLNFEYTNTLAAILGRVDASPRAERRACLWLPQVVP